MQITVECLSYSIIGSDDGSVLNRRQAIIWPTDVQFYWRIF